MAEYTGTFLWPPYGASTTDTTPNYFGIDLSIENDYTVVRDAITGNTTLYRNETIQVKEKRYPRRYYIYRLKYNILIVTVARNASHAFVLAQEAGCDEDSYVTSYPMARVLRRVLGEKYKGSKIAVNTFLLKDVKTGVRKVLLGV